MTTNQFPVVVVFNIIAKPQKLYLKKSQKNIAIGHEYMYQWLNIIFISMEYSQYFGLIKESVHFHGGYNIDSHIILDNPLSNNPVVSYKTDQIQITRRDAAKFTPFYYRSTQTVKY